MDPQLAWLYKMILQHGFFVHDYKVVDNIAYISLAAREIKTPTQYIKLEPKK